MTGARFGSRALRRPRHGTATPADGGDPSLAGPAQDPTQYAADPGQYGADPTQYPGQYGADPAQDPARYAADAAAQYPGQYGADPAQYPPSQAGYGADHDQHPVDPARYGAEHFRRPADPARYPAGGGSPGPAGAGAEIGLVGARFSPLGRRLSDPPPPLPSPDWPPTALPSVRAVPDVPSPDPPRLHPSVDDGTVFIRPYIRTGGRTRGPANLGIETLVSVNPDGPVGALQPTDRDHHLVVGLCRSPRSVAEVAALTSLPLGVARVLLADMARIGVIRVHRSATAENGAPDLALMQRVLAGLHRL